MNIFTTIESTLSKASSFLISVFTKTADIKNALTGAAPSVIGAVTAVFYDVMKAVSAGESAAAEAATGNAPAAFTLSETTLALIKQVITDFHAGEASVVSAFKALKLPTPPAPPATS